jgi:hypothetical protein
MLIIIVKIILFFILTSVSWLVINQLYAYLTLRNKTIKLRSIINGNVIIDEDLNTYQILLNPILGCSNIHSKIFKLKIDSCYKIKIYGIDTPFTKINIVDIII